MCENILTRTYCGFNVSSTPFHLLFIPFSPSQHHYLLLVCEIPGELLWVGSMDSSIWRYHTNHQQFGSVEALKHTLTSLWSFLTHTETQSCFRWSSVTSSGSVNPSQLRCCLFWFSTSTIQTWWLSWSLVPCFLNMAIVQKSPARVFNLRYLWQHGRNVWPRPTRDRSTWIRTTWARPTWAWAKPTWATPTWTRSPWATPHFSSSDFYLCLHPCEIWNISCQSK